MTKIKAGFVQMAPKFGDIDYNLEQIQNYVAKNKDADLLVFPELATTGYKFESRKELESMAEQVPNGKTVSMLEKVCKENNVYIVVSMVEKLGSKVYNTAVLVGPDGYIGKNQKTQLFFEENLVFDKGETGYNVFRTPIGDIGVMICFDYMFPEAARTLALKGADIICNPCCLKTPSTKVMTAMRTRALENGVYTICVNRVGEEKGLEFTGGSEIAGPRMEVLASGEQNVEDVKIVEMDMEKARDKTYNEYNNLIKDRRVQFYSL